MNGVYNCKNCDDIWALSVPLGYAMHIECPSCGSPDAIRLSRKLLWEHYENTK